MHIPRLREWRELRGWAQKDLAHESGVSARSIAGYETGASVRPRTARKLAEALEVEVADLVVTKHPLAEAPPSAEQPPLNGFDLEERRAYESRVWERINLLERAAEQWQRFIDEGLYDLKKLDLKTLKAIDGVSLRMLGLHAEDARALKAAATPDQRERLERAERQYFAANLDFWARVETESRHRERREQMRELTARISA